MNDIKLGSRAEFEAYFEKGIGIINQFIADNNLSRCFQEQYEMTAEIVKAKKQQNDFVDGWCIVTLYSPLFPIHDMNRIALFDFKYSRSPSFLLLNKDTFIVNEHFEDKYISSGRR